MIVKHVGYHNPLFLHKRPQTHNTHPITPPKHMHTQKFIVDIPSTFSEHPYTQNHKFEPQKDLILTNLSDKETPKKIARQPLLTHSKMCFISVR